MTTNLKVALSSDFLLQLSKLPASVHAKVLKWAVLFQADPTNPGINYENINSARDKNLKSVRLDRDWRGIVFKPDVGNVYVLLYVDHHDAAYRWAENRKLAVNPVTGAMQLVMYEQVVEAVPAAEPQQPAAPAVETSYLFISQTDHDLMSVGVPQDMLPLVRAIRSEVELDALQPQLPVEAYEGLFLLAAGDTVDQVLSARETRVDQDVDVEDFAAALDTPESRSRFVVISDDESLTAIMNAPLAQWRIFLHPTQHKLASGDRSGAVRVLGGAGTGKTVLAMHRAKWLAEQRTRPDQKVLFTTFTKNLATDIEQNLKSLCSKATMDRIEVVNLDAWVHGFMRTHKLEQRIVYDRRQEGAAQAWLAAMAVRDTTLDLSEDFYAQELEQIVLAQGITTLDGYRTARRTGRGVLLNRAKRDAIWPVFEEYRGQLASRKLKTVDDAYREVAALLMERRDASPYSAIIIDETQDLGPQALRLLRVLVPVAPNDLFFVGDGHQRIYNRHRAAMSKCGIDIRGRSKKLYINYRTTDEIRRQAVALLEGIEIDDLDEGHDECKKYRSLSHGPAPKVVRVTGVEGASAEAAAFIREWLPTDAASLSFCVIAHSEKTRDALAQQLQTQGHKTVAITAQANHLDTSGVVHVSTMHRAKGLEFDCVIVVAPRRFVDEIVGDGNERQLLYVALTRAKRGAALVVV